MKWSELETIKLIELYGEHECLWNITSVDYKNKHKRDSAYREIIRELSKENFGVPELKQKIKNIRSTYNQERVKIKKSNKSGSGSKDIYEPTLKWFPIMDRIMTNIKGNSETVDSLREIQSQESPIQSEFDEEGTASPHSSFPVQSQPTPSTSQSRQNTTASRILATSEQPPSKKAKYNKRNLQDLHDAVKELRTVHEELRVEEDTNENSAFRTYVGLALNKLPLQHSIMAQSDIQAILTKYRLSSNISTATSPDPSPHTPTPDSLQTMYFGHSSSSQQEIQENTESSNQTQYLSLSHNILSQAWNFS